jgi:AcrR family transcriptional regulator
MSLQTLSKRQEKTRLAFMTAFLRLIAAHGMDRISVTDIANEADYGRWTFYQYFESKEDVAWATFVYWMNELDNLLISAVKHLASPQREYESWRIIFQAFYEQRDFFMRLDSTSNSIWRVRMKEFLIEQFLGHLQTGNFALMQDVRPEIAARLYVAAIMELLEYWGQHPQLGSSETMAAEFFTFIFKQAPPK